MNKQKEKIGMLIKNYRQEWISFGIVLLLMIVYTAVTQTFPFQKFYCNGDTQTQILPIATMLVDKLKEGSSLYYSDYYGMGGNTTITFWFHAMSPFSILYFLLGAEWATCLSFIFKLAFAALFFSHFCRVCLERDGVEIIIFSVAYALCGYAFAYKISMMLDALYFLPLTLVLVECFVIKKKILELCFTYLILFLSNFYVAFLVGLTSFVYLLVIHLICNRYILDKKEKSQIIIRYIYAVVTALCISAFFVLPAVIYEFNVQSGIEAEFIYTIPKIWDVVSSMMFGQKYDMGIHIPYLYCSILTMLVFPFYFFNKEIKKKEKIIAGISMTFLILCIFIPPLYRLIHLFNYPNGLTMRFAYLLVFIMLSLAVRQWKYMHKVKFDYILLFCAGILVIYILTPILNGALGDIKVQIGTILCFAVYLSLVKLYQYLYDNNEKHRKYMLFFIIAVVGIEMTVNGLFVFQSEDTYEEVRENTDAIERLLEKKEKGYDRVKVVGGLNPNQTLISRYYGMDVFTSGLNKGLSETLGKLGFVTNDTSILSFGSTEVSQMLLDIRYTIDLLKETPVLEEQDQVLPLGYMIADEPQELKEKDAFINLNRTLSAFAGEDIEVFEIYDGEIMFESSGIKLSSGEKEQVYLNREKNVTGNAWIMFAIPLKEDDAYLYWNTDLNEWISNGPYISVKKNKDIGFLYYGCLTQERIYKMEEAPEGYYAYIFMNEGDIERFVINRLQFSYLNKKKLEKAYDNLSMSVMDISEFHDGYIKGKVTATDEKRLLFVSVPYEPGWSVYSDGEEIPCISLLEGAFLGTELTPGEHTVEFVYHAPGSDLGRYISILGCALLLLYILYLVMTQNLSQNNKKK